MIGIALQMVTVYFAFRYTGSGKSTYDGTFEVDDIRVYDKAME